MNKTGNRKRVSVAIAVILLTFLTLSMGQAGTGLSINWWTVDGGGGMSSAGQMSLNGSVGQPDAGTMSGGSYHLRGGFWTVPTISTPRPPEQGSHAILLPVVIDGD
jgi:hypothetical protein